MATYRGVARLTDPDGGVIKPEVNVELSNDRADAPSYARSAPYFGQFWVREGDLMISPLRQDPRCVLLLDDGTALHVRVNSWDRGGSRAQIVGEDAEQPPRWQRQ